MGVIQRQGIKHSIVNFVGMAVGMASTLLVYSRQEVVEAYGLVQYLLSIGMIGFPLFSIASSAVSLRFFPHFEDKPSGHHGFLTIVTLMPLLGWCVCAGIAALFWGTLRDAVAPDPGLLREYLWAAFPLTLLYTLGIVLSQYASNLQRIVVPSILFDFSLKIVLPALMIVLWMGWLPLAVVLPLLILHFVLVVASLLVYLNQLGERFTWPDWQHITPQLRHDIGKYAGFGVLSGVALLLTTKADTFLVGTLTDMKRTGIYAIALNIAVAMDVPVRGLLSVSIPIMSKYLADENWTALRLLYQKVSINLLTAGLLLFGCIAVSASDLYRLMPNNVEVSQGQYVLLILCAAKIVEMSVSLTGPLVYFSRYYRYSLVSLCILAVANVCFNIWLIPIFGLPGAAIATFLSITCYNLFGAVLVRAKFDMQPFSRSTALVFVLAIGAAATVWFLPSTQYPLANIVLRAGIFALLFGVLVVRLRVSEDINAIWSAALMRMRSLHQEGWRGGRNR